MQKRPVSFKHKFEYFLFRAYLFKFKLLPPIFIKTQARIIHFLFKRLSKRHSRIVSANLKIAFPQKTETEIKTLKQKVYKHFSVIFSQILFLYAKKKPKKILPDIEVKNLDTIKKILTRKKGVIVFSAHFGNWELIPFILNRNLNKKIYCIARKMDNPLIEKMVKDFRSYMGSEIIYKIGSIRTVLKELENNNIILILIDQNTLPREGVFVDFFSRKVSTITSVSQLHLKKKYAIVPLFVSYEQDKIVLDIQDEIKFPPTDNLKKDILDLTQQCTSLIEDKIGEFPDQWFWFHNRWKNQLQGEINEDR